MIVVDPTYIELIARDRAEGDMLCTIRIERMDNPSFNANTGSISMPVASLVYEGKARIALVTGPVTYSFADESDAWQNTNIYIPYDTVPSPQVMDIITVIDARDPRLVGRVYQVEDVDHGGQYRAAITIQASGTQPSPLHTGGTP